MARDYVFPDECAASIRREQRHPLVRIAALFIEVQWHPFGFSAVWADSRWYPLAVGQRILESCWEVGAKPEFSSDRVFLESSIIQRLEAIRPEASLIRIFGR